MGNTSSGSSNRGMTGDLNSLRASPLQFHDVHGDNIELLCNKTRARRHDSFCKGVCFSNRPININERVYVKFVETNRGWSGVLRFGFTSVNPATLRGSELPRYACPDLTNKPGNWAKALGERYTASNILLHFSVNRAGDVHYSVNGEDKGLFFSGVATDQPLWAMLDIYGNTVGVEFSHANAEIEPGQFDASPAQIVGPDDVFNFGTMSLEDVGTRAQVALPLTADQDSPVVHYHANINFNPMTLHALQGHNVRVSPNKRVAARLQEEYCNAYVFTARPLACGETVAIQVLNIDRSYIGGLGFGLTACDPATVNPESLPDDSDNLLDRLEYWVVNKDVCRNPEIGDEISFCLSENGEVTYARNNQSPITLMHVDRTLPLWAFFDVYGNIQRIKVLGVTPAPIQGRLARTQSTASPRFTSNNSAPQTLRSHSSPAPCLSPSQDNTTPSRPAVINTGNPYNNQHQPQTERRGPPPFPPSSRHPHPQQSVSAPSTPANSRDIDDDGGACDDLSIDCKVCWEKSVNCVLYTCGHMCLCYECATRIHSQHGLCPICRCTIMDVIKTYRS